MVPIAKAGLGLIGLGAIGVGGVAFTKPAWLGINKEISWTPLSQDKDYKDSGSSDPYNNKFGSTYKNYLVGVIGKEKGKEFNKGMWEKLFEKLKNEPPNNGKFKYSTGNDTLVDKAYNDNEDTKALNKVCDAAYKASETDGFGTDNDNDKFNKEHVWKYCSYIGEKPKTVSDTGTADTDYPNIGTNESIGKNKKTELLSVKGENNKKLWELKNDEFFGLGVFKTESKKTAPTEKFFEALFNGKNKSPNALKNKCEEAYKLASKEPSDTNQPKADDVIKYCSAKSIK